MPNAMLGSCLVFLSFVFPHSLGRTRKATFSTYMGNIYHDGGWVGSQNLSTLDLVWVKIMCGEFTSIVGLYW